MSAEDQAVVAAFNRGLAQGYALAQSGRYCTGCGRRDDWRGETAPGAPCVGCGRYPAATASPRPTNACDECQREKGCGRLDRHEPHEWTRPKVAIGCHDPATTYACPGPPITEGARPCVICEQPVSRCRCEAEIADERGREWAS